jgi:molybdopterin synthase catalytic subunit
MARLTRDAIDPADYLRDVSDPGAGAVAAFVGVVRAETNRAGAPLAALEYTAYEPMALREMDKLCTAARERFALHGVRLVHRLGALRIGEPSVAVAASAAHRQAALDACGWIMEELKRSVPIFKRECWADGSRTWVESDGGPRPPPQNPRAR